MLQRPQRQTPERTISPRQNRFTSSPARVSLKSVVDASPSGVVVVDVGGTIVEVNNAWRKFAIEHGLLTDRFAVGTNYLELRKKPAMHRVMNARSPTVCDRSLEAYDHTLICNTSLAIQWSGAGFASMLRTLS